jgi:O-antigen/teichoic acid export membrane protein
MNVLHTVRRSQFLTHNAIFFAGSVAVGALNYLYYPVMGRLLPPAAFGEVQALISLSLQITIFLSVLGLVTINIVTNYRDELHRNSVVLEFEKLALIASILCLLLTLLFQKSLAQFFQFESSTPFVLLMVALVCTVPFTFRGAFLRGKKRFGLASLTNIGAAGGKLLFSAILVIVGFGTIGAITGFALAQALAACLAAWWALRLGLKRPEGERFLKLPNMRMLAPELAYGGLVLVGSLIVTLQYSIDVVVVKHIFDPHTAGLYAGVASVARILFFLTASIALVLMPLVKIRAADSDNKRYFVRSLLLLLAIAVPVVLLFVCAPRQVMQVLMGNSYQSVSYLLPALSVAIFIVSVINLVVTYYLALRRYAVAPVVLIGGFVTYGLMLTHHSSLRAVVNSLLVGSIVMLVLLGVWAVNSKVREFA